MILLDNKLEIICSECINGRKYMLVLNSKPLPYKASNTIRFSIVKYYKGITNSLLIKDFECVSKTNKTIKSRKQIMRKEFYNYINNLKSVSNI